MIPLLFLLYTADSSRIEGLVRGVPVDNALDGKVEVECGPETVRIDFNTLNDFEGHVYVKGRFSEPDCRNSENGRAYTGIELGFNSCGVRRERSLNPRGVFIYFNVILSFHPLFITKVDRAFRVQCFYMEADKTVDTGLDVSMLTTAFNTDLVPMPVCRYEVLDSGPSGPIVEFAHIGQPIYHKWTCDSEAVNTFCMIVYGCYVDDTNGDRVTLLDDEGCALDKNLLDNIEYPTDLMAGKETHVFKYADRSILYFNCQIRILIKEPFTECPRPQCAPAPATRGKRAVTNPDQGFYLDVSSQDIEVMDITVDRFNSSTTIGDRGPLFYNDNCLDRSFVIQVLSVSVVGSFALAFCVAFLCLRASLLAPKA